MRHWFADWLAIYPPYHPIKGVPKSSLQLIGGEEAVTSYISVLFSGGRKKVVNLFLGDRVCQLFLSFISLLGHGTAFVSYEGALCPRERRQICIANIYRISYVTQRKDKTPSSVRQAAQIQ